MKIERPRLRGCFFVRASSSSVRRGDRFFPGTLFQDRHRRPAAGEPEKTQNHELNFLQARKARKQEFIFLQVKKAHKHELDFLQAIKAKKHDLNFLQAKKAQKHDLNFLQAKKA